MHTTAISIKTNQQPQQNKKKTKAHFHCVILALFAQQAIFSTRSLLSYLLFSVS
jgi:hypothetical protein